MERTKYNEVPKSYRRNYKKEFTKLLQIAAICFGLALFVTLAFWMA